MFDQRQITVDGGHPLQDVERNGELRLRLVAEDALDAAEDALDGRRLGCGSRKPGVGMKGAHTRKICFDGSMLEAAVGKVGDPLGHRGVTGWEIYAGGGEELGIERNEVEVGFLASRVRPPCASSEAVPEVESCASREFSMCLIPMIRDFVDEEVLES